MGGGDKPLLEVGGAPMLVRIIAALDAPHIAISANGDPSRFARFGLPVLADGVLAGHGPMAGVLAGLDWAAGLGASALLTVPGDTPFIPPGLGRALWPPPACAATLGQAHHLTALWPVACREPLRRFLAVPSQRAVSHFAASIGMRAVNFSVRNGDPFFNVNTGDDLATARTIAGNHGTKEPQ
jgi:molybdopterin-guanine dinucleotide biosynthesis protein A